jgi:hypothetical protein
MHSGLSRVTLHILPLLFFYGVLKFAPLLSHRREASA